MWDERDGIAMHVPLPVHFFSIYEIISIKPSNMHYKGYFKRGILSKILRIFGLSFKGEVDALEFQVAALIEWNSKLVKRIYQYNTLMEDVSELAKKNLSRITNPEDTNIPMTYTGSEEDVEFEIEDEYGVDFKTVGEA